MPTVERTTDHVIIKLPVETTDEQLQDLLAYYEDTRTSEMGLTSEQARAVEELTASARGGYRRRLKELLGDRPEFAHYFTDEE